MVLKDQLLVVNPVDKPDNWHQRHSWKIRGGTFPNEGWRENGQMRATIVSPKVEVVVPGNGNIPLVRCSTFVFVDTTPEVEDGAVVTVSAGGITPPQCVESETIFHEIPLRGKLIFLCVSPTGHFSCYYFEVAEQENSPLLAEVRQGWVMRWYACKGQRQMIGFLGENLGAEDALFLETEKPGFSLAKLTTILEGAQSWGETQIPLEFWETCRLLQTGNEQQVLNKAVKVSNLASPK